MTKEPFVQGMLKKEMLKTFMNNEYDIIHNSATTKVDIHLQDGCVQIKNDSVHLDENN